MKKSDIYASPEVQRRLLLHEKLCDLLGSRNVYFQPPPDTMIKYPAFIYNLSPEHKVQADDRIYIMRGHYSLTYIDTRVEACIAMKPRILDAFEHISVERSFTSDNLNHDVYNLYF